MQVLGKGCLYMQISQVLFPKDVFLKIRGQLTLPPEASIIIPVNAQTDLIKVQDTLNDIACYSGKHRLEIVLIINNYPEETPPSIIGEFRTHGLVIETIPQILSKEQIQELTERLHGPASVRSSTLTSARSFRIFTGRILGSRAASSEYLIHFDSDCRIPDATVLIDWYILMFQSGVSLAYTHVEYYELPPSLVAHLYLKLHHLFRWMKRVLFNVPTSRGSNYAVLRNPFIELYETKNLNADNKVGPSFKKMGRIIAYNSDKKLAVLTSGRDFVSNWKSLFEYLIYRVQYYWKRRSLGPSINN